VDLTGKADVVCRLFPADFLNSLFRKKMYYRVHVTQYITFISFIIVSCTVHSSRLLSGKQSTVISWYGHGNMVHMHSWHDIKSMRLAYHFTTDTIIMFPEVRYSTFKLVSFVASV